ncbi:ABC transporter permease [Mycolicibacterium mengxianglii]|uniref:ABC transporter permease n=1 Tax=Mycolicibacterium mengxianglii TaxID=2736649 RepID=UPI0018EF1C0C|nr:ABC transporter permease subunit [Mycolicibacterium mengxianglii]
MTATLAPVAAALESESASKPERNRADLYWGAASLALILVVWQLASVVIGEDDSGMRLVPGISDVLSSFMVFADYWPGGLGAERTVGGAEPTVWGATLGLGYNVAISLSRFLIGFVLGVAVGIGAGLLVSWSPIARRTVSFPAHFFRMMPLLAMLPLFSLWFGNSELGTYSFTAFAVAVLLFVLTVAAVNNVPRIYSDSATSLGASRARIYMSVIVPSVTPQLKVGVLLAIPFAWSAVLAAEVIGKQYGLGRILNFALLYAATDIVAVTALVVVIVAGCTHLLLAKVLNHLTRWVD